MSREAELKVAFDACDADKSGKISCIDIVKVVKAMGYEGNAEQVAADVAKEVGKNKQDQIGWDEFKSALQKVQK